MKILKYIVLSALILAGLSAFTFAAEDEDYARTIRIFKKSRESGKFFNNCYGYAVFPSVGKGGLIIGGSYGNGKVFRGEEFTGRVTVIKGSIGLQIGGKAFSEIIFFQDKRAFDEFTKGSFELNATAQAIVITAGAEALASTHGATAGVSKNPDTLTQVETSYYKGMAVFVHSKGGLMAEASVGGQVFKYKELIKNK